MQSVPKGSHSLTRFIELIRFELLNGLFKLTELTELGCSGQRCAMIFAKRKEAMNTPTVKQKIREAVLASLEELKASDGVREVARRRDIIATASLVPALLYIDTGETEVDRDATGQTYEFDFYVKILVDKTKQQDQQKDDLVGSVQRKLERLAVAGGFLKCGGEEKTSVTARFVFIEGPFVKFRVSYKRKCGEPETSY